MDENYQNSDLKKKRLVPYGDEIRIYIDYEYLSFNDLCWIMNIVKDAAHEVKRENKETKRLKLLIDESKTGNSIEWIVVLVQGLQYAQFAGGIYDAYNLTNLVYNKIKGKSENGIFTRNRRPNLKSVEFSLYNKQRKIINDNGCEIEEKVELFKLKIKKEK